MSEKSNKADQLAQNIKSTCSKLQQEMEDKPYIRPGKGETKIWSNLADLKDLLPENKKTGYAHFTEEDDGFYDL